MLLTVQDILPILLKRGRLAAGGHGLERKVEYFDILEQPDIKPWMRPNTLMVTTGYAVRNDKEALLNLIQTLNEGETAALVIKTRFFDVFPEEAVEYCQMAAFPLILLHNDVSFLEITYPLMEAIVSAKNDVDLKSRFQMGEEAKVRHVNLFTDLVLNKYVDWEEMDYRISSLRWPPPPFRLAVIRIGESEGTKLLRDELMEQLCNAVRLHLSTKKVQAAVIQKNKECICLCAGPDTAEETQRLFGVLHKRLEQLLKVPVKIGVSDDTADYRNTAQSYLDVQDARRIAEVLGRGEITLIQDERYEQIFLRMSREPFWKNVVKDRLAVLEYYDCNKDLSLIETIEALIKHMGNRKAAAQELFLHRNTMSYRIKKIEALTGMNLSDGEHLIQLSITLRVRKYL